MPINLKIAKYLFYMYLFCLIFLVFLTPNRHSTYYHYRETYLIPLESTLGGLKRPGDQPFWGYWFGYVTNLFVNVGLFMPMGFLLKTFSPKSSTRRIVWIGALISMNIELLQLTFRIGVCDIDDVILNTLGTWCGVLLFRSFEFKVQGLGLKAKEIRSRTEEARFK